MSILSIKNLGKNYDDKVVLENINVEIKKGDIISIIGFPGSGKSTFLRAINFYEPFTTGEIFLNEKKLEANNIESIRQKIGMVLGEPGLFSHLNVLDNIMYAPLKLLNSSKVLVKERAQSLLKSVGLSSKENSFPAELTKGQQLRIALVRCLAMNPDIVLLDDPTKEQGYAITNEFITALKNIIHKDLTLLMVTREMEFIRHVSNRVFYMDEKGIYEEGNPSKILENPKKPKTKEFIKDLYTFHCNVIYKDFDFIEMYTRMENFCYQHSIAKKSLIKMKLLAEEMVVNIVIPIFKECSLNMSYSKKTESYLFSVSYQGEDINALEKAVDQISVKMVKKCATKIWHTYEEGVNTVFMEF